MTLSRRTFLEVAAGGAVYALALGCARKPVDRGPAVIELSPEEAAGLKGGMELDYTEWLVIHPDGSVTAHTGRTEIGQGLTTVLSNVICQGLELHEDRVEVILGDTDRCPEDGPTVGSSATMKVGWGYWLACERIRQDLVRRAADRLHLRPADLLYSSGEISSKKDPTVRVSIGEFGGGALRVVAVDPDGREPRRKAYVDRGTSNVNSESIVTGTLRYTADLLPGECAYGGYLLPPFHRHLTELLSANVERARGTAGIVAVAPIKKTVAAVGRGYEVVRKALDAVEANWQPPNRPRELDNEGEIRAGAQLVKVIEQQGDPDAALLTGAHVVSESYVTQYASQAPIETETAVARVEEGRATVWVASQDPFRDRKLTARALKIPESQVHVIGMPTGGGFGVKAGSTAAPDAAILAKRCGETVKLILSRRDQFQSRAAYKESVLIDIVSAVSPVGKLLARTIDIHQDVGFGTVGVYDVPNVRARLFNAPMPTRHGVMRGTSYVQTCFAVESHTDMVAEAAGMDPLDFRKANVAAEVFRSLLDACAEMIGYDDSHPRPGRGIGFAICRHGGNQFGAVAAEVSVDRANGRVRVERLAGAFDIGTIVNINTLTMGVKGAMIWGLGYALLEEVELDGHSAHTSDLDSYRIARFADVPPIELAYLDVFKPGRGPAGCGELPVIPTIGAICNAVYRAIHQRFYTLPMTPERVLAALEGG